MKLLHGSSEDIEFAAQCLKNGGIGGIPTETVYGLAGDAFNPSAVARIFEVKNRPTFNPLIVHIHDRDQIQTLSSVDLKPLDAILTWFWPGPLTIVVPKHSTVPDLTTGGRTSVAIRMPSHPITLELLKRSGLMLAAPSANPFNYLSPTTAQHVARQLGDQIDFILDGGPAKVGIESTVISFLEDEPVLLRQGGTSEEALQEWLPALKSRSVLTHHPDAPGQLDIHYQPRTPLYFWENQTLDSKNVGIIWWDDEPKADVRHKIPLSPQQDLTDAAARFFSLLHHMDQLELDGIYIEGVPEVGLGRAIMERLRKAVKKN